MEEFSAKKKQSELSATILHSVLTYFKNPGELMDYTRHEKHQLPSGSGFTVATCKRIIMQLFDDT